MDAPERVTEFHFIRTAAAQLKGNIPSGMHSSCCNFQQPHANGVHGLLAHLHWKDQPLEPVEQVVGQGMELQTVRVDQLGLAAYSGEIKAVFALLDEVLHFPRLQ